MTFLRQNVKFCQSAIFAFTVNVISIWGNGFRISYFLPVTDMLRLLGVPVSMTLCRGKGVRAGGFWSSAPIYAANFGPETGVSQSRR